MAKWDKKLNCGNKMCPALNSPLLVNRNIPGYTNVVRVSGTDKITAGRFAEFDQYFARPVNGRWNQAKENFAKLKSLPKKDTKGVLIVENTPYAYESETFKPRAAVLQSAANWDENYGLMDAMTNMIKRDSDVLRADTIKVPDSAIYFQDKNQSVYDDDVVDTAKILKLRDRR